MFTVYNKTGIEDMDRNLILQCFSSDHVCNESNTGDT